ncbi:MAG TPA: undecaprenyl-diphosphate phosphatase [Oligoflexia bacterium]|nr:undecaprenyl-diphosphate phosphatase [Oligoflexia bacterium]HMP27913.1 undecaprenyl-diphosphate phosphatase [Oligoflexia bacterium]
MNSGLEALLKVFLLSLIEGITEFLPISSTGHLILFGSIIGAEGDFWKSLEIFIQGGAILAVVVLYHQELRLIARDLFNTNHSATKIPIDFKAVCIITAPILCCGAIFGKFIKERLFFPSSVACALILGGIIILAVEWFMSAKKEEELKDNQRLSYKESICVGLIQCLALWPGISRSLTVILPLILFGFSRKQAAEVSFIVAIPILILAASYDLAKSWHILSRDELLLLGIGGFLSFIFALAAIKIFISILSRYSLKVFGWYRIILGLAALFLI